jgi:hypothetical protein
MAAIAARLAKLKALAAAPGTPGEGDAARAAIDRIERRIDPNAMFLSVADAATYLAESEWTIRDKLRRGVLAAKKSGTRTLVTMASIRAHAESLPDAVVGRGAPLEKAIEGQRRRRARRTEAARG